MQGLQVARKGPIATVTLDRPTKRNAFDVATVTALHEQVAALADDAEVACVVVTGSGSGFCAGGDLAAMRERLGTDAPGLFAELTRHLHPTVRLLATMDKPTLAAVNGVVAGGGWGLALGCDLRIASDAAKFKTAYFALGVVPDGGITWLLPHAVGPAKARELLFLDEVIDAPEALRLGLVNKVVPADRLEAETMAWAERLAMAPRSVVARTKRLVGEAPLATLDAQLRAERRWNAASAAEPDLQEGLRAFTEKRAPRFPSAHP